MYSRRATPLAAWTSGLEVANVVADADRACLVLETGVNQRWRYGNYRRSAENTADANAWEAAKIAARYATASVSSPFWCTAIGCGPVPRRMCNPKDRAVTQEKYQEHAVYAEIWWPWRRGLHFLAVQKDEDAEDSAGLWLLQSRDLPKI